MTIQATWVPVSTAPVLLASGGMNGLHVKVFNAGGPGIFLDGGTTISGTNGFQLGSGAAVLALELENDETLYAITASGTATVQVLKGGA
jgi:hypothetical protein